MARQQGTDNNDTLIGWMDDDEISGGDGDDLLMGWSGDDTLHGDAGDDRLVGMTGDDELHGGSGDDLLVGGFGSDTLYGGSGSDALHGNEGDDTLWGGTGADVFHFREGHGADTIRDFEAGTDTIDLSRFNSDISWEALKANMTVVDSGLGNHVRIDLSGWGGGTIDLVGIESADHLTEDMFRLPRTALTLEGGDGADVLDGRDGDDTLTGGAGDDTISGSDGDDTIAGGAGDDMLYGDGFYQDVAGTTDRDTFVYGPGGGNDTIADFTDGEDVIDLSAFAGISGFPDLSATQDGDDVVIDFSGHGGGSITLWKFSLSDLDEEDFIFHGASGNTETPVDGM